MNSRFQVGDVVRARSGGPAMTVERVDHERRRVGCLWFTARGMPHHHSLPAYALELAAAEQDQPEPDTR